jgi:hypothetical protein
LHFEGQHDAAIAEFERAFALNPNFIDHRYGYVLQSCGRAGNRDRATEASILLDPFAPAIFSSDYTGGQITCPEAVHWLRECASRVWICDLTTGITGQRRF